MSETIDTTLKAHGYSVTKVRRQVFNVLDHQEPQSMREIITTLSDIDRASVYRTISLFEDLGIVHRLQQGWKYKLELTDKFHPHHHHISCVQCGKSEPITEDAELERSIELLAKKHGFQPQAHQLEIQGLCKTCQNKI